MIFRPVGWWLDKSHKLAHSGLQDYPKSHRTDSTGQNFGKGLVGWWVGWLFTRHGVVESERGREREKRRQRQEQ